jgi:hypothetical protein
MRVKWGAKMGYGKVVKNGQRRKGCSAVSTIPVVSEGIKEVKAASESNGIIVNEAANFRMVGSTNYVVKTSLKCCFLNARGLLGKLDELKLLIHELGLDIIGIAETWLGEEVENVEIMIEGYKIYRKDRSQINPEKHGGVLLYVKNDITTCDCGDLYSQNRFGVKLLIKLIKVRK